MIEPSTKSEELFLQIHRLIKHGDIAEIRHLLDEGLSPNFANRFGWTPLLEGNTALGELLISAGAAVDQTNRFGQTPFTLAMIAGRVGFIKLLLERGAAPDTNLERWLPMTALSPKQIEAILSMVRTSLDKRPPS